MNKNELRLKQFIKYCEAHPEERFWQALRNWAGVDYIYTLNKGEVIRDTFYDY